MSKEKSTKKAVTKKPNDDVVLVHSPTTDGKGYNVLRKRGNEVSTGQIQTLRAGKAIHGEVVRLKPREQSPALFDVEVQVDTNATPTATGRPAKVASQQYRKGWDSIWAKPRQRSNNTLN